MASEKVETVIAGNYLEMERELEGEESGSPKSAKTKFSTLFWHGGSAYDAWFSCSSNQANSNYIFFYSYYSLSYLYSTHIFINVMYI